MTLKNNSYLTAIARKTIPAPTKWLYKKHIIKGPLLDYGCGKCHELNLETFGSLFAVDGYDPFFRPMGCALYHHGGLYNTIICNYVLNVIPDKKERTEIIEHMLSMMSDFGRLFISVRNDSEKLLGYNTRGTWQGLVTIPKKFPHALVHQTKDYTMYMVFKT